MSTRRALGRTCAAALVAVCTLLAAVDGDAHPMGNFSISRYAALRVTADAIELRYVVDMAEIPTFQELQDSGIAADARHPSVGPYVARQAAALASGLAVEIDGRRLSLETTGREILFTPGAGNLPTMKLGMRYRAAYDPADGGVVRQLVYRDENFAERAGWKEVIADTGANVLLAACSVPARDRSRELSDYPTDLLNSPPQVTEARVAFAPAAIRPAIARAETHPPAPPRPATARMDPVRPASTAHTPIEDRVAQPRRGDRIDPGKPKAPLPADLAAVSPDAIRPRRGLDRVETRETTDLPGDLAPAALRPNAQARRRDAFTDLIAMPEMSARLLMFAALVAAALGAVHALEPGHGKTVVAAYLVGSRGTARHALLLGLVVTASHTAGVYLLGAVTLYASRYVVPDQLYPWLGALSGVLIAGLGIAVFARRARHHRGHDHPHDHGDVHPRHHSHDHRDADDHHHRHEHDHRHDDGDAPRQGRHEDDHTRGDARDQPGRHVHGPHGQHHHVPTGVSLRELLALGITGGIVPCPAALVVLLSAVALRRIGFGLFLIVAFSVGLAAVLIAVGMLMVYARALMARIHGDGVVITRWLPMASSAVVTLLGFAIALQALTAGGLVHVKLG